MKNKTIIWLVLVAAAAAAGWHWWPRTNDKQSKGPPPVSVSTHTAERRDMPIVLTQVGNVEAYETVAVRSRIDSQVVRATFKDGDEVAQGALLFVLDDRVLKAEEQGLFANLARDRAQLVNLQRQYERVKVIAAKGYETRTALDQAEAAFKAQQATVNATQAALANVRVQLGYTQIVAPISGRAGTINITPGNTVKANDTTPLVTINQVRPIRIRAALPQEQLGLLRAAMGQGTVAAEVLRDGSEGAIAATLDYVDNGVDPATGTVAVYVKAENENEALWPGMFATIRLTLGVEKQALVVPEVAVQHGQSGDYVFVIEQKKARRSPVKVLRMQDGMAVIGEGIKEGEPVVTDGTLNLRDGATVALAPTQETAK